MKTYLFTFFFLAGFTAMASQALEKNTITITGELSQCNGQSVNLYSHDGIQLKVVQRLPLTEANGKYAINAKVTVESGFYFVGTNDKNYKIILIDQDKKINIKGVCNAFQSLVIESENNQLFDQALVQVNNFQKEFQGIIMQYRQTANNPALKKQLDARFADLDKRRVAHMDGFKKSNPFIYRYLALNTYLSFQNNHQEGQSEADYFAKNYISINFKDEAYNRVPHLMDISRNYAQNLTQIGLTNEGQINAAKELANQFPKGSISKKSVLAGVSLGFMDKNNTAFAALSDLFTIEFGSQNPGVVQFFNNKKASMQSFIIGGVAPELAYNSPEGEQISLSSLKGKIVMIDFWASWCRPCRLENPHVKKLYSQYKDKGFDILGVSLDRKKAAWVKAIETDGLPWHHVSDLKGWQSAAAKTYGVNSIPQTVLVGRDGKIIARNLRGPALDRKLAELFANDEESDNGKK